MALPFFEETGIHFSLYPLYPSPSLYGDDYPLFPLLPMPYEVPRESRFGARY